ncbi:hypothetical protein [Novosphingobium sp. 9]|uniref:hypothetical protein n=1 Tax=Novosphingobium sp. 9 TaxID=2025349 RepID=UPI0021B68452|nr:hypothetical protein [Novosphingobium sp. 9]
MTIRMRDPEMANPLSDHEMLSLGRQYLQLADRDGASADDQTALRDFMPALLHRLGEKVDAAHERPDEPVLDLRFCGVELPADDPQTELALPEPE